MITARASQHIINFVGLLRDYRDKSGFSPRKNPAFFRTSPNFYILGNSPEGGKPRMKRGSVPAGSAKKGESAANSPSSVRDTQERDSYFARKTKELFSPQASAGYFGLA